MSCLSLLKLLDVCKWIFVFILFLAIHTCCVKGWEVAHWIFACKKDKFTTSIMFISHIVCFGLHCSTICHCFLVLYLFNSCLFFGFPFLFIFVNISLQQSNCIMFISCVVCFSLHGSIFYCCLFILYLFNSHFFWGFFFLLFL
jgi:hypothetical protein